ATAEAVTQLLAMEAASQGLGAILPGFKATGRIENSTWRRSMAQVDVTEDEAGRLGLLLLRNSRSFMDALPEGAIDALIEVGSEKTGPAFRDLGRILNKAPLISKLGAAHSKVAEWWVKKYPKLGPKGMVRRVLEDGGYDGVLEEYMEERAATLLSAGVGAATGWQGFQTMEDLWPGVSQSLAEIAAFTVLPVGGAILTPKTGNTRADEIIKIVTDAHQAMSEEEVAAASAEVKEEIEVGEEEGFDERELGAAAKNALRRSAQTVSGRRLQAEDMTVVEAPTEAKKGVERALRQRGVPVVWVDTEEALTRPAVFLSKEDGGGVALSTHLSDTIGPHGAFAVATHEAFHSLKDTDPELWNKVNELIDKIPGGRARTDAAVEAYLARLSEADAAAVRGDPEAFQDEAVANAVQELGPLMALMFETKGGHGMVREALTGNDRGLLQRLLDWLSDILGSIYGEEYVPAHTRRGIEKVSATLKDRGLPVGVTIVDRTTLELADLFTAAFDGMISTEVRRRVEEGKKPKPAPLRLGQRGSTEPAITVDEAGVATVPGPKPETAEPEPGIQFERVSDLRYEASAGGHTVAVHSPGTGKGWTVDIDGEPEGEVEYAGQDEAEAVARDHLVELAAEAAEEAAAEGEGRFA
ncbi:MAG: hypothetical protein QF615_03410, partial [Planctomycetota bacterium]|nr:hypothetical protein [Planctomycetota bacterium]